MCLQMKKRQMKAQLIMESKGVDFRVIDICDPNCEDERRFMQKNAESKPGARNAIPPQFFNDEEYCGVSSSARSNTRLSLLGILAGL